MIGEHMESPETTHQSISLLLVDDEDSFRLILKEVLSSDYGLNVLAADSGEAAVNILDQEHVDVVLLDYKMPGMNGLNVLQWMLEKKMETPVIMLTAAGSESVAVEAMKLGAYDYIRKEQIDLNHIPVIVRGVHERYLFRKEKQQREVMEREQMRSILAIEKFHSTLASLSEIIGSSLAMVATNIERYEAELLPHASQEQQESLAKAFAKMQQQYSIVSSATKSILNMANNLHANIAHTEYTTEFQQALESYRAATQEQMTQLQNHNAG
jgi:DNA-binding NarL/FixJ family response regulator